MTLPVTSSNVLAVAKELITSQRDQRASEIFRRKSENFEYELSDGRGQAFFILIAWEKRE